MKKLYKVSNLTTSQLSADQYVIPAGGYTHVSVITAAIQSLIDDNSVSVVVDVVDFLTGDNLAFVGTGDGTLTGFFVNQETGVAETWTITATSATNFTVTGSVSGAQAAATVGTRYDNGIISFLITAGATPFVALDEFTIDVISFTGEIAPDNAIAAQTIQDAIADMIAGTEIMAGPQNEVA